MAWMCILLTGSAHYSLCLASIITHGLHVHTVHWFSTLFALSSRHRHTWPACAYCSLVQHTGSTHGLHVRTAHWFSTLCALSRRHHHTWPACACCLQVRPMWIQKFAALTVEMTLLPSRALIVVEVEIYIRIAC